ncbi:hypothetical protein C1H66_13025 [Halomonas heilongjiangensis]|uniref:Uncharacterized protein n=1 Tax=Halomonas heilongjiangensis TaxID=1387883 RepID=A0A2N7TL61_9GAMM|nr:hypothetical protein C1H66_13025 [Halomonas heilongjiangensis]
MGERLSPWLLSCSGWPLCCRCSRQRFGWHEKVQEQRRTPVSWNMGNQGLSPNCIRASTGRRRAPRRGGRRPRPACRR